jgi:replicative DNA helicase
LSEVYTEESVISALLRTDGDILAQLPHELNGAMFQDEVFANAYGIYQNYYDRGEKLSLAVLQQKLVSGLGGMPTEQVEKKLHDIILTGYSLATVKQDALALIQDYKTRRFNEILGRVQAQPDTLSQAIDYLQSEFENLKSDGEIRTKPLPQIVVENKDKYFREHEVSGFDLEFPTLNELIGGLDDFGITIIAARPAVGKSAFATQITMHFCNIGKKVCYFNLEMSEQQIYERFVSAASGIGIQRIRRATKFTGDEKERFEKANRLLEEKDKIIISTGSQTVSTIRSEMKNKGYDMIIVDYLQLIKPEGRYRGNRFAEVGEISHSLKAIATDFHIPVIVISQLNRVSAGRENKEPTMSELRESGDIEQDASTIVLLWNLDEEGRTKGCKVDKNRQGKVGKVTMQFNGDLMRFEELTDSDGFEPIGAVKDDLPFVAWEGG